MYNYYSPITLNKLSLEGVDKSSVDFEKKIALLRAKRMEESRQANSPTTGGISPVNKLAFAGSGIGFALGVALAFNKKTGFWKGWGYAIVGAVALGSLGRGIGFLTTKNN